MDFLDNTADMMSLASIILVLLFNTNRALCLVEENSALDDCSLDNVEAVPFADRTSWELDSATRAPLHHVRICNTLTAIDEDLGYWVKPRSTTWFTRFLLHEYDDSRWVQMFRMTKRSLLSLSQLLSPAVKKKDTKYRSAVPVTVRVACTLFKLSHGASLLICSELFAVGRSTVSILLREVVHAINVSLRNEISWPFDEGIAEVAEGFYNLCGLPGVLGAIDGTHFAIGKPRYGSADYFYFKSGGYTINCQAVVDSSKRFLDLYVGMPGSTNDSRMLRRSRLFYRGQRNSLWQANHGFAGFSPYLLGDAGYPLLPWLMVPHRDVAALPIADALFNRKLSRGRAVVENAFGLLKQTFRELHQKSDLHVTFIPDMVTCCAILHNVLLKDSHEAVERLMEVLHNEEERARSNQTETVPEEVTDVGGAVPDHAEGRVKRRDLGVYLSLQRIAPF